MDEKGYRKMKDAEYYKKNREKILSQKREYYLRIRERKKIYDSQYRLANLKKISAYHKRWENINKDKVKEYSKKHYENSRKNGALRAVSMVFYAVKVGKLTNLKNVSVRCSYCGKRATQYDHRDYNKPLDVNPVCQSCNIKLGPAKPINQKEIKQ